MVRRVLAQLHGTDARRAPDVGRYSTKDCSDAPGRRPVPTGGAGALQNRRIGRHAAPRIFLPAPLDSSVVAGIRARLRSTPSPARTGGSPPIASTRGLSACHRPKRTRRYWQGRGIFFRLRGNDRGAVMNIATGHSFSQPRARTQAPRRARDTKRASRLAYYVADVLFIAVLAAPFVILTSPDTMAPDHPAVVSSAEATAAP
jgi:hypothetical protein